MADAARSPVSWQADPCARPRPAVPPRLVAGVLLAALALRLAMAGWHGRPPVAWPAVLLAGAVALGLGGCLWWVAHRQVGVAGAVLALTLYTGSAGLPALVLGHPATLAASLGLFAMLYTGVGVAHALQGPRRKWPQRITLMAGLCAFTAIASPAACAAGLLLALAAMLYLAEGRRRLLPLLFAAWAAAGLLACLLLRHSLLAVRVGTRAAMPGSFRDWGAGIACAVALAGWLAMARSRYFGNSAPLLAAGLLAGAGWASSPDGFALTSTLAATVAAILAATWAAPFVLLFIAGVFADGLEGRAARLWIGLAAAACLLQWSQTIQS